jgi:hypothetical protein
MGKENLSLKANMQPFFLVMSEYFFITTHYLAQKRYLHTLKI